MCTEALNVDNGDEIDSIGRIKEIAGGNVKWLADDGSHLPDSNCLCWVDVPGTLVAAGYRVWLNPDMLPTYLFDMPPSP